MPFAKCKVYSDGGHYIAIPHTTRPYRPRRKPNEEVITVTEEIQSEQPAEDTSAFSEDESAPVSLAQAEKQENGGGEEENIESSASFVSNQADVSARRMTRKELFEELYQKNIDLPRRQRKAVILAAMRPYFKTEDAAEYYVDANLRRKTRNLIERRVRMTRKVNLQEFNFFVTFTYNSELHTEESFQAELKNCLKNLSTRKHWKYIGVWERSPKKGRLHFHGLFYIPEGTMPGKMLDVEDYNFNSRRRQVTHQNTYFNERFGRSDFEPIERGDIGAAIAYIVKYIEKSGEKIVYSKGLPQFFISDIMEEDVVCPCGLEDKKLLLFDDFGCWDEGCYMGKVSEDVIKQMPKAN